MGSVLIVGGGIAGIQAALNLSELGIEAILIERESTLGGTLRELGSLFSQGKRAPDLLERKIQALRACPSATILTNTEISEVTGAYPRFTVSLKTPPGEKKHEVAALIVTTGFKPFDPSAMKPYGYKKYKDVITALELATMLKEEKLVRASNKQTPHSVTFIQCIGSRDTHAHTYCSYFCCMYAVHMALQIKEKNPRCMVNILYMDIRTPFCSELTYEEARIRGVRFYRSKPAKIRAAKDNGHLTIQFEDTLDGSLRFLPSDMVVLSIGASPPEETASLASALHLECEESGFYKLEQPPVFTKARGVFLAGCASGPKDVSLCLAEASAAAVYAAIALRG
jgi:heterodisulfide reductase subunit A